MTAVTGSLVLPDDAPVADGVRAVVRVRDITLSDAPADVPVRQIDMPVNVAPGAQIGFEIDVPADWLDRVGRNEVELNLEAHIDRDGSGSFSPGDFVSMTAQPVGPDTPNTPLEVPLVMV